MISSRSSWEIKCKVLKKLILQLQLWGRRLQWIAFRPLRILRLHQWRKDSLEVQWLNLLQVDPSSRANKSARSRRGLIIVKLDKRLLGMKALCPSKLWTTVKPGHRSKVHHLRFHKLQFLQDLHGCKNLVKLYQLSVNFKSSTSTTSMDWLMITKNLSNKSLKTRSSWSSSTTRVARKAFKLLRRKWHCWKKWISQVLT